MEPKRKYDGADYMEPPQPSAPNNKEVCFISRRPVVVRGLVDVHGWQKLGYASNWHIGMMWELSLIQKIMHMFHRIQTMSRKSFTCFTVFKLCPENHVHASVYSNYVQKIMYMFQCIQTLSRKPCMFHWIQIKSRKSCTYFTVFKSFAHLIVFKPCPIPTPSK